MSDSRPNYELVRERLRRARRHRHLSLRDVADQVDVSASTLSRIERGTGSPDIETLNRMVEWLGLDRDAVFSTRPPAAKTTPEHVEVLLRADKDLDPQTAKTLAKIFRTAYRELAGE